MKNLGIIYYDVNSRKCEDMKYKYRDNQNYAANMRDYYNKFPNYSDQFYTYDSRPLEPNQECSSNDDITMADNRNWYSQNRGNLNNNQRDYNNRMPNQQIPRQPMPGQPMPGQPMTSPMMPSLEDQGPEAISFNINEAALENDNFRQAIWTGEYFQITLMSIDEGSEIGMEVHTELDQLLYIVSGEGLVLMGDSMDNLDYQESVYEGYAIIIPAGTWHNLVNEGDTPIKLFSLYAPPAHPHGTVHQTKEEADEAEENY